jgi:hypothetical protein
MDIYTQKDIRVRIDENDFYCNSFSLQYDAEINPRFNINAKNSFDYAVAGAPKGSVNLTYYLTGSDPLADKIVNERTPVSLDFNGLQINSGYMNKYSFSAEPHSTIQVSASFGFFEKINGTFSAQSFDLPMADPLSISDMSLDNGSEVISEENIKSLSYDYSVNVNPVYQIHTNENNIDHNGKAASRVTSQGKKIEMSFSLYDYDISLPNTGQRESFKINLKNKNGVSKQTYDIDGFLKNKSIGVKPGDRPTSDYSLGQANLGGDSPVITSISPTDGGKQEQVTINGNNFLNLDKVLLGEFKCDVVSKSDTVLVVKTSPDIISGYKAPMRVITQGGEIIGATTYTVTGGLTYF